ncbi:MAG: 50S ribosomal protein L37e [Candidatus Aenigmarchaeota archaeon]|nr:50S ribosomal protein L37e [Candidatus Aenigmarchaeota archaeon]
MVGKGTPSQGKRQKRTHVLCRRCGKKSYHYRKKQCSACGYGETPKIKRYAWQTKILTGKRKW